MRFPPEKLDPRMAGDVVRYHNEKMIQVQTVASHSWNVARLLLALWPMAPRHLIVEALIHDVGEILPGDTPGPGKWCFPQLREAVHEAEEATRLAMTIPWQLPPRVELTSEENAVLSAVDLLDAWEHAMYEVSLGNRFAAIIVARCDEMLAKRFAHPKVPKLVRLNAAKYMEKRRAEEAAR